MDDEIKRRQQEEDELRLFNLRMRAAKKDPEAIAELQRYQEQLEIRVNAARSAWGFPAAKPPLSPSSPKTILGGGYADGPPEAPEGQALTEYLEEHVAGPTLEDECQ